MSWRIVKNGAHSKNVCLGLETELAECREEIKTLKGRAKETAKAHCNRMWDLQQQLDKQKQREESIARGHQETKDLIQRFFHGVISALPAIKDYIKVKMPDNLITTLLDGKPRSFKTGATLYDPDEEKDVDAGNVEV